jgi:glycogen operon protein
MRRTQGGNNNAYCHDNEANWLDWTRLEQHADVHRFVRLLAARRVLRDRTANRTRLSLVRMLEEATTAWHGIRLFQPDWGPQSRSLAFGAEMPGAGLELFLIMNAYWEPLEFELPAADDDAWRRWIDTSLDYPEDIVPWQEAQAIATARAYCAGPRSVVALWRKLAATPPASSSSSP